MKTYQYLNTTFFVLMLLICFVGLSQAQDFEHERARTLVDMVHDAVALVEEKGENAFDMLSEPGSRWRHDDTYIVVFGSDGEMFVHPSREMLDRNHYITTAPFRKHVVKQIIRDVQANENGHNSWTHYIWEKPGEVLPSWKSTYAKLARSPDGREYIVGCGAYELEMEKVFLVDQVRKAAELIERKGKKAFINFKGLRSPFIYKDNYVFVYDENGVLLVNPPFSDYEGDNLIQMTDSHGKYTVREFIETAKKNGSGWVDYQCPKPGNDMPVNKTAFVKKVEMDEQVYVVGSGMYTH